MKMNESKRSVIKVQIRLSLKFRLKVKFHSLASFYQANFDLHKDNTFFETVAGLSTKKNQSC